MELTFRFIDKENWSFYATLNVLIPLFLFYLDKIDKKKKFTLGYEVVVMKKCQ